MTARSASRRRRRTAATPPGFLTTTSAGRSPACLAELGTGVFQVAGGAPGGTKETRRSRASWRRAPAGRRSTT